MTLSLFCDTQEPYRLLYLLKIFLYERMLQDKVSKKNLVPHRYRKHRTEVSPFLEYCRSRFCMVRRQHFVLQCFFLERIMTDMLLLSVGLMQFKHGLTWVCTDIQNQTDVLEFPHNNQTIAGSNLWQDLKPNTIHRVIQKQLYW